MTNDSQSRAVLNDLTVHLRNKKLFKDPDQVLTKFAYWNKKLLTQDFWQKIKP